MSNTRAENQAKNQPGNVADAADQGQDVDVDVDVDVNEETQKLPFSHILKSVLAAAIGVQSKKNQQKDFNSRQAIYIYIIAGVGFTTLFVLGVAFVVKSVLANAG